MNLQKNIIYMNTLLILGRTDSNAQFTDIRIEIQNQDQFLLPSESYLYIEAELSYGEPYKYENDIGLINNAIIYLFDRVSYKLSEREIEGYSCPKS